MTQYERIRYPDGQISVKSLDGDSTIATRINSYEDLFYVKSISSLITGYKTLFIPCLFGQRSDRRFASNQSFDLKIICDFINGMNFNQVSICDPHSDVSLALIDNSVKISSLDYVKRAITNIKDQIQYTLYKKDLIPELVLVSPDAGAYKKVFEYGEKLNLPVVAANKHRDLDGKINLKFVGDVKDKECLIVDDICDGGWTFYLLAKALREQGASKVYLYVSHGYFSKGFHSLLEPTDENSSLVKSLDHIYCTNSVKDIALGQIMSVTIGRTTHIDTVSEDFFTQYKII